MYVIERTQHRIDHMRCPAIGGLDSHTVHTLHKSMVHIDQLRRSIERTDLQLRRSWRTAYESEDLLRRLRKRGY